MRLFIDKIDASLDSNKDIMLGISLKEQPRVIDFGFDEMKLHSIESAGFVKEAYFREDYFFYGAFYNTIIYSRLK